MSPQYSELRPTSGWDRFTSLGHPCKLQLVSRLGSVTARQSSSEHQPNIAALNRGRHLRSAGRSSRWALAHIVWTCFKMHTWLYESIHYEMEEKSISRQKSGRAVKNWVMRCWRDVLFGARCKWFAYGPADATATPSSLASLKFRLV